MGYVLVASIGDTIHRIPLWEGALNIGSVETADIRLDDATVSRQHAVLKISDERFLLEDLKSRNGTRIRGKRIQSAVIEPGITLSFGRVSCVIEKVCEDDLELGMRFPATSSPAAGARTAVETAVVGQAEQLVIRLLPELIEQWKNKPANSELPRLLAMGIYSFLPVISVDLQGDSGPEAPLIFSARRSPEDTGVILEFPAGSAVLRIQIMSEESAKLLQPLLGAMAGLLADKPSAKPTPASEISPPPMPEPPAVDSSMLKIYRTAGRIAPSRLPILILGESGTGKEVLARYIHAASSVSSGPFLALNCAALPDDLLESELFGIEQGVATGVQARSGRFELADGGTLLLDEIGDMAMQTQAKILRVLQSGEVYRIGAREPRTVNVRLLAATNHNLREAMSEHRFREDLYHRLAGWEVTLPPLRRRVADIPNLAAYFLQKAASERGISILGISKAAIETLRNYSWPGNVRELEREMAKAALFIADGEALDTARLSPSIRESHSEEVEGGGRLERELKRVERQEISSALSKAENPSEAAKALGISRATLYRRIRALKITIQEDLSQPARPEEGSET